MGWRQRSKWKSVQSQVHAIILLPARFHFHFMSRSIWRLHHVFSSFLSSCIVVWKMKSHIFLLIWPSERVTVVILMASLTRCAVTGSAKRTHFRQIDSSSICVTFPIHGFNWIPGGVCWLGILIYPCLRVTFCTACPRLHGFLPRLSDCCRDCSRRASASVWVFVCVWEGVGGLFST